MFALISTIIAALNLAVGSFAIAQGDFFWGVLNVVVGVLLVGIVLAEEG